MVVDPTGKRSKPIKGGLLQVINERGEIISWVRGLIFVADGREVLIERYATMITAAMSNTSCQRVH